MNKLCKLTITLLLAGIILLSFTGCGTDNLADDDDAEPISAEELMTDVLEAITTLETYHQESEMTMATSGSMYGREMSADMVMNMTGDLDTVNGNMMADVVVKLDMDTGFAGIDDFSEPINTKMFVVDNEGYASYTVSFEGIDETMWMKMEFPDSIWRQQDIMKQQQALLEHSEFETIHAKTEMVNGVECYLVDLDPDLEKLWDTTLQMTEQLDTDIDFQEKINVIKDSFKKVNVKYWIAKETFTIMKLYEYLEVEFTAEQLDGSADDNVCYTIELSTTMSDHNKPVDIVLPEMDNVMEMP